MSHKKVVIIGGGTGSFTLLSSLKKYTPNITALVNMADDGGSTGLLRDELGVLPPGDVRQCLIALSESPEVLRNLFNFRFPKGSSFAGHSFGNLFLSALELMTSSFDEGVAQASRVLDITGQVLPVTLTNCNLVLESDGGEVRGEYVISQMTLTEDERPKLRLEPQAGLHPRALEAIMSADLVVIAPGNLYGSLAPALLVKGMGMALKESSAPVAYVCNLVNKPTQTKGYAVHTYVDELERLIGFEVIDYVLYNTVKPGQDVLDKYAAAGELPVSVDHMSLERANYQAIAGDFLSKSAVQQNKDDTLIKRSLIRHNADAICKKLMNLI